MLQDRGRVTMLGAPEQLAPASQDLIGRRDLEACGGDIWPGTICARRLLGGDAQAAQPFDQTVADSQVGVQDHAGHQGVAGRRGHAVSQLVGVEDRPPARWSPYNVIAVGPAGFHIECLEGLVASE